MQKQIERGLVVFREDHTKPPFRKAHLVPIMEDEADLNGEDVEDELEDDDEAGMLVMGSVLQKQAQVAVKVLRELFGGKKVFENPKDHEVIARLIGYVSGRNDLILDAFAGSGTTGHAVLQMNKADGGNRRFICIEMDEKIAADVTAQRLRKVSEGYTNAKREAVAGLGGGFRYCTLGKPLFDEWGNIDPAVTFPDLAAHVFFAETGVPIPARATGRTPLLGEYDGRAVYLLFNGVLGDRRPGGGNVLTRAVLEGLPPRDGPRVVYGEACRLSEKTLAAAGVTFRKVPFEIKVG